MREIQPHPEEQRSYAELRAEFRASALANLRAQMKRHPSGYLYIGEDRIRRDFTAAEWAQVMLRHLDASVTQDFGLLDAPSKLEAELADLAEKSLLHESVTWDDSVAGVTDHDAPPCSDVSTMSDDQLCDYVDSAIKESENE